MGRSRPTVFAVDEYEAQEFDAVLVQERMVVCVDAAAERTRVIPHDKINHVDSDSSLLLTGPEIPDSFFGGAEYGFVDVDEFDSLRHHLDELRRENY